MSKSTLGIDVSKKELVVALISESSSSIYKSVFNNDRKGFVKLLAWLKSKTPVEVKVCIEATGNYSTAISEFLFQNNCEVYVINPVCIKAFARSKLTRTKTDEIDAVIIAQYAKKMDMLPYKPIDPALKKLRYLYRCMEDLKQQRVQVTNHLENKELLPQEVCKVWINLSKNIRAQIAEIDVAACFRKDVGSLS